MSKFSSQTLKLFLEKLGSSEPAPGGGAAAAVVIAQASALAEMAARLNLKRSEKQGVENSGSKKNIAPLAALRRECLDLLEKDVKIFSKLSKFKKSDREKSAYLKIVQEAAQVPYQLCLLAQRGIALAESEKTRTSAWLYSDLLESAILFDAGFKAARLNVEINLTSLKGVEVVAKMRSGLNLVAKKIKKNYDAIFRGKK